MEKTLNLLMENREIIEIVLIFLFAFSSKIREVIAVVSEMLQSVTITDDKMAMDKAVALLRRKVPVLVFIPAFVLRALIQWLFNSVKGTANKEIAEIKQWNSKSVSA